jgi:hypothetical protein
VSHLHTYPQCSFQRVRCMSAASADILCDGHWASLLRRSGFLLYFKVRYCCQNQASILCSEVIKNAVNLTCCASQQGNSYQLT